MSATVIPLPTPLMRLQRIVRDYAEARQRCIAATGRQSHRRALSELLVLAGEKQALERELGRLFPPLSELVAELAGGE